MNPTNSDPLLARFAATQPAELAGLLGEVETDELLQLVQLLPAKAVARLAASLSSRQLSRLLAELPPEVIGELLGEAQGDDAVALVSHLRESAYPQVLAVSGKARRKLLTRLFDFPTRSVAAMATTDFIRVKGDTRCDNFLTDLGLNEEATVAPIYVVNEQGLYTGVLNPLTLISRKNQKRRVQDIAFFVPALSGRMPAATALKSTQWSQYVNLPVVDGKKRLMGTVKRSQLEKVVPGTRAERYELERVLIDAATHYLAFCEHLLKLLLLGKPK